METKTKIMWMKVFMIFYIFCGVVGFYAALKTENILVFVIFIVIILILSIPGLYFAARIDAQPWTLKVEPLIKTLNVSSFEDFKNRLFQEAEQEGFGDVQTVVSDNNIETVLAFKCEKRELTILQTFWTDAFDEDTLRKMTDLFWEVTEKKIGEGKIQKYDVQLIQCICIRQLNEQADEFVHRNLLQNMGQYQSLSVITFDERRIYICQTNYKSFDKRFRKVEALLLKILYNLLA